MSKTSKLLPNTLVLQKYNTYVRLGNYFILEYVKFITFLPSVGLLNSTKQHANNYNRVIVLFKAALLMCRKSHIKIKRSIHQIKDLVQKSLRELENHKSQVLSPVLLFNFWNNGK